MKKSMFLVVLLGMGNWVFGVEEVTPEEVREIAKEAYIYGFPMVESYKTLYKNTQAKGDANYKGEFNRVWSNASVATPTDTAVVTPNSDTPYSFVWADLRTEPLVLTVPVVEEGRYFSLQFIDLYTQNFAYVGTRTTGNGGGEYLLAGPNWKGEKPEGISDVLRSETEIVLVVYRTQLFNAEDIGNVRRIQEGYKVEPLSAFLGRPAPAAAPGIEWPELDEKQMTSELPFFSCLGFLLQFAPVHPSEVELRKRFERIGVVPGKFLDVTALQPELARAMLRGMSDGLREFDKFKKTKIDTQEVNSGQFFGTREFLKNNYLYRFAGARLGIYGNSREEAFYPTYFTDEKGEALDGAKRKYVLRFEDGKLPPVKAFWSLTMYDGASQLLVANALERYLINSPMLSQLKRDADGGLTIYIQHESPGAERESNWLPAPKGPFYMVLRLYLPEPEVLNGRWSAPKVKTTK